MRSLQVIARERRIPIACLSNPNRREPWCLRCRVGGCRRQRPCRPDLAPPIPVHPPGVIACIPHRGLCCKASPPPLDEYPRAYPGRRHQAAEGASNQRFWERARQSATLLRRAEPCLSPGREMTTCKSLRGTAGSVTTPVSQGRGIFGRSAFCPEIFRVSTTAVTRCSQTVTDT